MVEQISVEVAFALPERQSLLSLMVPIGSTVQQVIELSGILNSYPEVKLNVNKVGIWSRTVKLDEMVKQGDRIEIYRALIADPKDMRRRRAEKAKDEGRADKVTGGRPQH
ncbi:MAG: RnfH family protein [Gammaproteobacteria bacterium]|nr:RnfH family protein [Gammaproteobacteria bacterium]MBU2180406.1 RnfH family protein [Gammaproteobacteria bacterium]MBU2223634.1 RnfH family protein [Gammaproteobacteria bacterium]MBU2278091.1 RnfH family protein [Gammaproteobacteria bacterium]MBU2426719.1 RnfH family protein [Gammaproteobacteria bacterium]